MTAPATVTNALDRPHTCSVSKTDHLITKLIQSVLPVYLFALLSSGTEPKDTFTHHNVVRSDLRIYPEFKAGKHSQNLIADILST